VKVLHGIAGTVAAVPPTVESTALTSCDLVTGLREQAATGRSADPFEARVRRARSQRPVDCLFGTALHRRCLSRLAPFCENLHRARYMGHPHQRAPPDLRRPV